MRNECPCFVSFVKQNSSGSRRAVAQTTGVRESFVIENNGLRDASLGLTATPQDNDTIGGRFHTESLGTQKKNGVVMLYRRFDVPSGAIHNVAALNRRGNTLLAFYGFGKTSHWHWPPRARAEGSLT